MQKTYRRLRTDYPKGVISIFDNGGKTIDRYTVVYAPIILDDRQLFGYLYMSSMPLYPQGVCSHHEGWLRLLKNRNERVITFADLPEDCQEVIYRDLKSES